MPGELVGPICDLLAIVAEELRSVGTGIAVRLDALDVQRAALAELREHAERAKGVEVFTDRDRQQLEDYALALEATIRAREGRIAQLVNEIRRLRSALNRIAAAAIGAQQVDRKE